MSRITTEIDHVTYLKLVRRARRVGMKPEEAVHVIATKGVSFFLALVVGATNSRT